MVQISNDRSSQGGAERAQRRAEARRLEILRAAARTFRRRGFAAAGMREIAAEADLSPGNLYHYFKGKDEILYFCQDRWLDHMLDVVRSVGSDGGSRRYRRGFETGS
jgi:AcrR family transcriptional regulator